MFSKPIEEKCFKKVNEINNSIHPITFYLGLDFSAAI